MRKFYILVMFLLVSVCGLMAQAPEKFSYQAVVRNSSNQLVINANVGVRVSLLQGSVYGAAVYVETHTATTNANGLLTLEIGGGTAIQGSVVSIDWGNGPYFLKTEIDPAGGSNYSVTSVQQMLSVPYALYAKEAANGFSGDYNDLTNTPTIPVVPTNVSAFTNDAGYITMDSIPAIPTVPTNVSAFTNDAGYLTGYTETDPVFSAWDKNYNDLTNKPAIPTVPTNVSAFTNDAGYITMDSVPAIPTNVSAFTNDAGYLTSFTEQQVLSISNDTLFLTGGSFVKLPAGFDGNYNSLTNKPNLATVATSGSYNDLTNTPTIPVVPTNVSAFTNDAGYLTGYTETDPVFTAWNKDYNDLINTPQIPADISAFNNDAGYITMDSIPAIPTVPTNVSAFTNDAGYLTGYTETDPVFTAWDKNYNDLTNKPTIPTVPTNVSAFTNDAGYLTGYTETDPMFTAWNKDYNDLINTPQIPQIPADISAFNNDAGYITMDSIPAIPTVPTNVSAFTNDAGYLSSYTETDPVFTAWNKSYNDLTDKPEIPAVPTNVSAFTNDAGYITMDSVPAIPTNISAFTNDAGYLTAANVQEAANIPTNVSAFTNDAGYLTTYTETDPVFSAWNKSYNDLTDKPVIPAAANDATLTIQKNGSTVGTFSADATNNQTVNITVPTQTSQLENNSGFITSADLPAVPTNLSQLNNDAGYITAAQCGDVDICAMANQLAQLQQQMAQMQARLDSLEGNTTFTCGTSTVTDHEGNVYHTVQIGTQCWTKENLRTTTSPSTGTYLIPAVNTTYTYTGKQAFWYNNDSATYAPKNYGLLYNWNAATDTFNTAYGETSVNTNSNNAVSVTFNGHRRGICPAGWHLPSDAEWTLMTDYVSSQSEYVCGDTNINIAKALADSVGWNSNSGTCRVGNDQSTNNATGFSAVPAGGCSGSSSVAAGGYARFWSATQSSSYEAYSRYLYPYDACVYRYQSSKGNGFSVRCLRDDVSGGGGNTAVLPTVITNAVSSITSTSATCGGNVTDDGGGDVTARGVCWSTSQNPTINDSHTTDGSGTGTFTSNLTSLTAGTTYYVRAYATNGAGTAYGEEVSFTTEDATPTASDGDPCPGFPTVTDIDGNTYNTVKIGEQCWMKENLRTTKFPDNTPIPLGTTTSATDPYRYSPYGDEANVAAYGYLYNWTAAMHGAGSSSSNPSHVQGICPEGWHLPSTLEWQQMYNYLRSNSQFYCNDNTNYIAKALASTTDWSTTSTACAIGNTPEDNNQSGFGVLPAGQYYTNGYSSAGLYANYWSTTQYDVSQAFQWRFTYNSVTVNSFGYEKKYGFSVRCVLGAADAVDVAPSVTTLSVGEVTKTTATCVGEVTNDGGAEVTARGFCYGTSNSPTLSNGSFTVEGTGAGEFTSHLTGLTSGTNYYVRAYATNSEGTTYGNTINIITTYGTDGQACPGAATVTDVDGNTYNTVMLGNVCWMKENLRTTKFADGTPITLVTGSDTSSTVAYRYCPNNDSGNVATYGYLYNWTAFIHNQEGQSGNIQGICPTGWHIPKEEMSQLANYVGGQFAYICDGNSGNNAKALASTEGWNTSALLCSPGNAPETNNATTFGLRPAGYRELGIAPVAFGIHAVLWHATSGGTLYQWPYRMHYNSLKFQGGGGQSVSIMKTYGYSVRCVRN